MTKREEKLHVYDGATGKNSTEKIFLEKNISLIILDMLIKTAALDVPT